MSQTALLPAPVAPGFKLNGEALVASSVVFILLMMIVPLPGFLLDALLAANIALSLAVMLTAFYAERPLEFGIFPGLLLMTTLFRLSLNVASTRLILSKGEAGHLIAAFGEFVVAGNYVVGGIIFLVLVLINFVVITKGSGRIAEVGARFTLDALPGKQMAIDADLNAGIINEGEAKRRREEVSREADFYGAMDGASKFVRGDAVAGLIITGINILGGLIIGATQLGLPLAESAARFTLLSIGDGLVSQIPALLISTAAGIIVSRASGEGNLASDLQGQLFSKPGALYITGGFLAFLGVMPGLPLIPFWGLAAGAFYVARRRMNTDHSAAVAAHERAEEQAATDRREPEQQPKDLLLVEPLELEIGYSLIPAVDPDQGGDLLERVKMLRQQLALEMGIVIPPVRIRDNVELGANQYVIKLRGNPVAQDEVLPGYHLALLPDDGDPPVSGIRVTDPTFGLPAVWVAERNLHEAERLGLTTVEAPAVVTTHLLEVLRKHAHQLLSRQETQGLVEKVKEQAPALVEELVPGLLSLGAVQKILRRLLQERVPIRDLVSIMEAMADHAATTKNLDVLTEYVRSALAQTITRQFTSFDGRVHAVVLDGVLEGHLLGQAEAGKLNPNTMGLDPQRAEKLAAEADRLSKRLIAEGHPPVILTSPVLRGTLFQFLSPMVPDVSVLSYHDLVPDASVDVADQLKV